jgi:hypothetical protein
MEITRKLRVLGDFPHRLSQKMQMGPLPCYPFFSTAHRYGRTVPSGCSREVLVAF